MLQYSKHADANSIFNTPPFAWYLSGKFLYVKDNGGLDPWVDEPAQSKEFI